MSNKITVGKPGPGRPKGSPNKVSKEAKAVIAEAAEKLGGVKRLVTWAKADPANEKAFWSTIYPKLVAITVAGDPDAPVSLEIVNRVIRPES